MQGIGYRVWGMGKAKLLFLLLLLGIATAQDSTIIDDSDYFYLKYIEPEPATQQELLDSAKAAIEAEKSKRPRKRADEKTEKKTAMENFSYEDLFRAAFKTEIVRAHYFMVRIFADGKNLGNAEVSYDSAFASFVFSSVPFSNYLDFILLPNERSKIKDSDGFFNSNDLKELDFEVKMDERAYELSINLPPNIKSLQTLSLGKTYVPRGTLIKPASFSFFTNLRVSESFYYSTIEYNDNTTKDYDRNPFYADMDGAMAAFGWALEGSGNFREVKSEDISSKHFRRGDIRLIRDLYSMNSRLTLGDVGQLAGVRYEYSGSMFSRNRPADKHKINFFLPRASYIEIHIDGKMTRRVYMPSGYHEISGFSGSTGLNTIQVFIHHADGTMEEVNYQFELGDSRTLHKGESRYYLNAGIRRTSISRISSYKYHPEEPGLDAEYRFGLFHSFGTGYTWRVSQKNIMTGLQIYNVNPLGYTELSGLINSEDSSSLIGKRAELSHYVTVRPKIMYMENASLSMSSYIQNPVYNPNLFTLLSNPSTDFAGVSGNFSTSFLQSYLSVSSGVTFNRNPETNGFMSYNYGINASKNLFGFSLSASASSSVSKYATSYYFSANVGYTFGINKHRIRFSGGISGNSYETETLYLENPYYGTDFDYETSEYQEEYSEIPGSSSFTKQLYALLGWSWADGGGNTGGRSYSASASIRDNVDNLNANLSANYNFNRMQLNGSYAYSHNESSARVRRNVASVSAATSFMFADGLWAFGRPVRKGFILADADQSLAGSTVRINYSQSYNNDLSQSGAMGAAYQNNVSNYSHTIINIRLNNVPIGAWLEQNQYYVVGAYKQGYALRLGNEMRVFLQVRLKDGRGYLSNYYTGILELDKDGNTVSKKITFTSKDGVLQMGNLLPGKKYRINFDQSTYIKDVDIEIPSNSEPFLELPDITVER